MACVKKYKLGRGSLRHLAGVHPDLVQVVKRAIEITEVDFSVVDGLRTVAEQTEYVRTGVSRTMKSMHLPQPPTDLSHAVDIVPWINGRARWELPAMYPIVKAMRRAAQELKVPLRWGGGWCRLDNTKVEPAVLVEAYVARKRRQGRTPFIDGPHYALLA